MPGISTSKTRLAGSGRGVVSYSYYGCLSLANKYYALFNELSALAHVGQYSVAKFRPYVGE